MIEDAPMPSMAAVSSFYQTIVTRHVIAGPVLGQQLLNANPRRYYLRVMYETFGAIAAVVLPGPLPTNIGLLDRNTAADDWVWRDCPSVVTGEFYAFTGAAVDIITIECVYVR